MCFGTPFLRSCFSRWQCKTTNNAERVKRCSPGHRRQGQVELRETVTCAVGNLGQAGNVPAPDTASRGHCPHHTPESSLPGAPAASFGPPRPSCASGIRRVSQQVSEEKQTSHKQPLLCVQHHTRTRRAPLRRPDNLLTGMHAPLRFVTAALVFFGPLGCAVQKQDGSGLFSLSSEENVLGLVFPR